MAVLKYLSLNMERASFWICKYSLKRKYNSRVTKRFRYGSNQKKKIQQYLKSNFLCFLLYRPSFWKDSEEKYVGTQLPVLVNHLQIFKNSYLLQIPSVNQVLFYVCLSCLINIIKCSMYLFTLLEEAQNGQ